MGIVSTLIGWTADLIRHIGFGGLVLLILFFWLLRHGGKAIAPWAKGARDITFAGAAFAGLLRLTLGPKWQRYAAGALLAGAWWWTLSHVPGVRLPLVLGATGGLVVFFLALSATMAHRHGLQHMPPLAGLLEGYRREQTKDAVSGAVKAATHRSDDETRIIRWVEPLDDRIRCGIEPCPGQSVQDISNACTEGKVGPQITRALRQRGMPVPAHAAEARVTGEHEGAAVVEIMTTPPRPRLDLTAESFAWPGPVAS